MSGRQMIFNTLRSQKVLGLCWRGVAARNAMILSRASSSTTSACKFGVYSSRNVAGKHFSTIPALVDETQQANVIEVADVEKLLSKNQEAETAFMDCSETCLESIRFMAWDQGLYNGIQEKQDVLDDFIGARDLYHKYLITMHESTSSLLLNVGTMVRPFNGKYASKDPATATFDDADRQQEIYELSQFMKSHADNIKKSFGENVAFHFGQSFFRCQEKYNMMSKEFFQLGTPDPRSVRISL